MPSLERKRKWRKSSAVGEGKPHDDTAPYTLCSACDHFSLNHKGCSCGIGTVIHWQCKKCDCLNFEYPE